MHASRLLIPSVALAALATALTAQCENAKPLPGDLAANDQFGSQVALDTDRLVVGAPLDDDNGSSSGSVYVFDASGMQWSEVAKLTAADGAANDEFGATVAIDGGVIAVGARLDDDAGTSSGAVYVFELVGASWVQTAKLVASDGAASDQFGTSVAVDGTTVVVGSPQEDAGGSNAGAVYVFQRLGAVWSETQKLVASDAVANDRFGTAVGADGGVLVGGAQGRDDLGSNAGGVYVFASLAGTYSQSQKLLASDGAAGDAFGSAVRIRPGTVLVGAPRADVAAKADAGAVYVFDGPAGALVEASKLTASDAGAGDQLGFSVSLAGDGATALLGAYRDDDLGNDAGAAYAFTRPGVTFTQAAKLVAGDGKASDNFGSSVAVDGDRAVAAGHLADPVGTSSGAVWTFSVSGTLCPSLSASIEQLSLSAGGTQVLTLAPGPAWADAWYWVLGSATGTTPGVALLGTTIPLNFDPYFLMTAVSPNQGPLVSTVGMLDPSASGQASISVAAGTDPALAGLHMDHAYVLWDPLAGSIDLVSNAVGLDLAP